MKILNRRGAKTQRVSGGVVVRTLRLCVFAVFLSAPARAQLAADALFYKLRDRVQAVKDYTASVKMRIDVPFMRVPQMAGTLYYKSPDKLKLERAGGLSILPKKGVSLSLNHLIPAGGVSVLDAGREVIDGRPVRILKVIPNAEGSEIVLTKIWVDEARMLALRAESTTRDNGTVKLDLQFGKHVALGLPDRATFYLDVKEYKLPKGVTMDYGSTPETAEAVEKSKDGKRKKGTIRVEYLNYKVNTGLSDAVFVEKKR